MPDLRPVVVPVKFELDEVSLAELREKFLNATRTGQLTVLPPGPPPGTWEINVQGGPAFAANAATACRFAADEVGGLSREVLLRLAVALDTATYGGDPEGDPQ